MQKKAITAMGDSLTFSNSYGLVPADHYLYKVKSALAAEGRNVTDRNLGIGGNTSAQMLGRVAGMTYYEVPTLGILYAGANDQALALVVQAGATATSIPLASGASAYVAPGGYLVIGGETRLIASVSSNTVTLATALSAAPAAGTTAYADTRRNLFEMGSWLKAQGCNRVLVIGSHYKNWSSGGDTTTTQDAYYGTLRTLQQGAVADLVAAGVDAVYSDTYAFQRAIILAGTGGITQGDNKWSAFANNQHLSALGHSAVAEATLATIRTKPEWLSALA